MSQSALNGTLVNEDATPVWKAQLKQEDGTTNLAKSNISTAVLRVINVEDGAVVQSDIDVLADIDANGLLQTTLASAYLQFIDTTKLPLAIEPRLFILTLTLTTGKIDVHHLLLRVTRSTEGA